MSLARVKEELALVIRQASLQISNVERAREAMNDRLADEHDMDAIATLRHNRDRYESDLPAHRQRLHELEQGLTEILRMEVAMGLLPEVKSGKSGRL